MRELRWAVWTLLLAGCLRDELVQCASGIACPIGLVCDDTHQTCVEPERITSCETKPELAPCLEDGACHEGVCFPVGCGNGRRDPGETCDDGNTASADGCSADCSSLERCGNAQIDPVNREQCDTGDLLDHDGCDSRCQLEEPDWTPYVQLASHPPREQMAVAYDSARERLVLFGGFEDVGVTRNGATLEWDGVRRTWLDRTPAITPTARVGAGFAYDAERKVSVLFGGSDFGGAVADMWLWDGDRWTFVAANGGPSARMYAAMAYDPKGKRVLVFGGRSNTGVVLGDMWSWDGSAWTELHPQTLPPKRERSQMGYDAIREEMVIIGGVDGSPKADTWIFDGTDWRAGPILGEQRFGGSLVWDESRGMLALLGGIGNMDRLWDGTQWIADGAANFVQRMYPFVYYDPRRAALIGGLGYRFSDSTMLFDVLERTNGVWTPVTVNSAPPGGRQGAMVVYDTARARVVLYGGNPGSGDRSETFELEAGAWVNVPIAGPPARDRGASAYDAARERMVVWAGHATDPNVWEYDGATWTSIAPSGAAPVLRPSSAMTYVPGVGSVMMGGDALTGGPGFGDTWIWDGTAWTDVTQQDAPGNRLGHVMAYDPVREQIVLFGGANGSQRLGDTWTWTRATGWTQQSPPTSPPPRSRGAMVWDPARRQVLLVGGLIGAVRLDEVWAWDGTTWTRHFTDFRITSGLVEPGTAYDAVAGAVVAETMDGLFRFQWRGPGSDDACRTSTDADRDGLAGCDDPDCWALCTPTCPPKTSCP